MFLNFPDQFAPKLLFVDSSDILLGAVLMDVTFPEGEVKIREMEFDTLRMREL